MSVAKAMQRMNTLRNRIEEYKINRKAYNYEQYQRQSTRQLFNSQLMGSFQIRQYLLI